MTARETGRVGSHRVTATQARVIAHRLDRGATAREAARAAGVSLSVALEHARLTGRHARSAALFSTQTLVSASGATSRQQPRRGRLDCMSRGGASYEGRAMIDATTPYALDTRCQALVAEHPDGMSLEQIGDELGLTRERIRQIEAAAMQTLMTRLAVLGVSRADVADMLASKPDRAHRERYADGGRARLMEGPGARDVPLAVEPYSERGQRVEDAIAHLERIVARMERR